MPLETSNTISGLNAAWPIGATDPKAQGDDHLRLIKQALKATFPTPWGDGPVTSWIPTQAEAQAGAVNNKFSTPLRVEDQITGKAHTFTQSQVISGVAPMLSLNETDGAPGASMQGRVQFTGPTTAQTLAVLGYLTGPTFVMRCFDNVVRIDADFNNTMGGSGVIDLVVSNVTAARVNAAGTSIPTVQTVITREKGDARYTLQASDARLKQNVYDMALFEQDFMLLRPVNFEWVQDEDDPKPSGVQFGMIAQEVQRVFPSAVVDRGGPLGLDPLQLIGILVAQVQNLAVRVGALEAAAKNAG